MSISRQLALFLIGLMLCVLAISNVNARHGRSGCQRNGGYCQTHWECCSRKCMTYSYVCAPIIGGEIYPNRGSSNSNQLLQQSWLYQNKYPLEDQPEIVQLQDDKTLPVKADTVYETPNSIVSRTCKSIGDACNDSSECCSVRCHFYLHKCVT